MIFKERGLSMQQWEIGYHSPAFYPTSGAVYIYEVPAWAYALEKIAEFIDAVILRHRLCDPPRWTFHIPLGLKREDGMWDRSLGLVIFRGLNALLGVSYKRRTGVHTVDVTDDWLRANDLWPSWRDEDDEEDSSEGEQ
jgi:hypothetical protein